MPLSLTSFFCVSHFSIVKIHNKESERDKKIKFQIEKAQHEKSPRHFFPFTFLLWQASEPSRIVNVSSMAHKWGRIKKDDLNSEKSYSEIYSYAQSKLANILFTRELATRLKGTRVTVNALHPGTINTELTRHVGRMTILFHNYIIKPFVFLFFKTPKAGAQTTLFAGMRRFQQLTTKKIFSPSHYSSRSRSRQCQWTILLVSWFIYFQRVSFDIVS